VVIGNDQTSYMNELILNRPMTTRDLMTMASRELAAFFNAVTELFGPEKAVQSAEDWLHELAAGNDLPTSTRQWRTLTVSAAAQLASRVNASKIKGHPEKEERQ
jgi:alkylhydroperoxidase/carboxymuconolactone decarboxylase family protein YurZ